MKSMEYDLPFWGTCQGFQLIGTLLSDNYTLLKQAYDDVNVLHSLEINKNTRNRYKMDKNTKGGWAYVFKPDAG